MRPALADLMDRAPPQELLERVAGEALAEAGVLDVEKVLARRAGVGHFIIGHVQAQATMTLHDAYVLGGRVRSRIVRTVPSVIDAVITWSRTRVKTRCSAIAASSANRPRPRGEDETGPERSA